MRTEVPLEERIKQIIADQLCLDYDEVVDAASLENDFGADSLDRIELVMELESEFDILISDEEVEFVKTVEDTVKLIEGKVLRK